MRIIERDAIPSVELPGRVLQRAVGKDSFEASEKMTVGFANHMEKCGAAIPHAHAEECVYIVDAKDAWIRVGPSEGALGEGMKLAKGQLLHIGEGEWHVFQYAPGGFCDVMFIYGQVSGLRPEDKK